MGILIIMPKLTISRLDIDMLRKMSPDCIVAFDPRDMEPISNEEIVAIVANFFNKIPVADILGKKREKPIVHARHIAMYLLHELGMSYSAIGRMMNRDHSTVCHAIASVKDSLDSLFDGKITEDELCGIKSDTMVYIKGARVEV